MCQLWLTETGTFLCPKSVEFLSVWNKHDELTLMSCLLGKPRSLQLFPCSGFSGEFSKHSIKDSDSFFLPPGSFSFFSLLSYISKWRDKKLICSCAFCPDLCRTAVPNPQDWGGDWSHFSCFFCDKKIILWHIRIISSRQSLLLNSTGLSVRSKFSKGFVHKNSNSPDEPRCDP